MDFKIYNKLQNLLLSIDSIRSLRQARNFIIVYDLLKNKKSIYTMKLMASIVYSRPKLFDQAIALLKMFPKIVFDFKYPIYTYDLESIRTDQEIIERLKIIFLLFLRSGHLSETKYDIKIASNNGLFNLIFYDELDFQDLNFKYFLVFNEKQLMYQAIYNDDLELLQKMIALNNIDVDQIFNFPHFEIYESFKSSTLLQYSAFFGSIQCFKYLLNISNNINFKYLLEYSIAGGNAEIIHIVENESHDINITHNENLLYIAIMFMNNDLIEYIIDNYDIKINGECYNKCIYSSNYDAFLKIMDLDNNFSINEYGSNNATPLITTAINGCLDFFIFLLSIPDVDYKKISLYGGNILHHATYSFQAEIINYILKNRLFDLNEKGEYYDSPIGIAEYYWVLWPNILEIFDYYKEIEQNELYKYNWFRDFNNNDDEKYFIVKKRYLDKKYKLKKLNNDCYIKIKNKKSMKKKFNLKFYDYF